MSDRPARYCHGRLAGLSDADAARAAGYSRRPGRDARRLWDAVELLRGSWELRDAQGLLAEVQRCEARLQRLAEEQTRTRDALRQARVWLRAHEVLEAA